MREIKFRQAIFLNSKFHHWHYWGFVRNDVFTAPETGISSIAGALKNSQMFTFLLDKHGKEVYEGDVLVRNWDGSRWPVEFKEGQFNCLQNTNDTVEVIGNIYENPELLGKDME